MSLAILYSRASVGIDAPLVTVEAHISPGLPSFSIVGLPETAVKESKDRVRSAIINSKFEFPTRRITVNLAPADLPKEGGRYDLAIALGILAATKQIPAHTLSQYEFVGELALTGELRCIHGVLPVAIESKKTARTLIVPEENLEEALLCETLQAHAAKHLLEVCAHLTATKLLPVPVVTANPYRQSHYEVDLSEVKGQPNAKRALEIAAAGGHHLLMVGPPGTGKTMLASRLPTIFPPLTVEEAMEVAAIRSLVRKQVQKIPRYERPFRNPHHTASGVALVGGGSMPRPGEISLAHHGVLFLDELPEFNRHVLEVLREPLESGRVIISRASQQLEFPAKFQLVAAMNPCPCGYWGDSNGQCHCSAEQIKRYQARLSGPLLDRFEITIQVPRIPTSMLAEADAHKESESSATVQQRVVQARSLQQQRAGKTNSRLRPKEIDQHCLLSQTDQKFLVQAIERFNGSARAYHRFLKVSRTIADLAGEEQITRQHLGEALHYRASTGNSLSMPKSAALS